MQVNPVLIENQRFTFHGPKGAVAQDLLLVRSFRSLGAALRAITRAALRAVAGITALRAVAGTLRAITATLGTLAALSSLMGGGGQTPGMMG